MNMDLQMAINDQIDIDVQVMIRALGSRWTGQFKKATQWSNGFVYRPFGPVVFLAVCEEGNTNDAPDRLNIVKKDSMMSRQIQSKIRRQLRCDTAATDQAAAENTGVALLAAEDQRQFSD